MRLLQLSHSILMGLTLFITACGNPPLIQPQPLTQPPTTVEVVEVDPTAEQTAMPSALKPPPTPTQTLETAPTEPTMALEPLSDKPINGYVFGKPEEIQGVDNTTNFNIIDWVPDSNNEIIVVGDEFVDTVNIHTGEKQRHFEWDTLTHSRIINPIWLQSTREVALILYNLNTNQNELWLNKLGQKTTTKPALTNIGHSFIPVGGEAGFGIYDLETQDLVSVSKEGTQGETLSLQRSSGETNSLPYHIAQSSDWIVYYNREEFLLVNLKTQETKNVSLIGEENNSLHIRAWNIQRQAQWSLDGSKLALILTEGPPPIDFSDLYIYNIVTDKLQKIQTPFANFVDAVTWTPDNRHVIVSAVIGKADYQTLENNIITGNANSLFLVDTIKMVNWHLPFNSIDTASHIGEILWSSNEKYIVARYRFYTGEAPVYRIEVTSP